jgi:hypothetical protein
MADEMPPDLPADSHKKPPSAAASYVSPLRGEFGKKAFSIADFDVGRCVSTGNFAHHRVAYLLDGDDLWGPECRALAITCRNCARLVDSIRGSRPAGRNVPLDFAMARTGRTGFATLDRASVLHIVSLLERRSRRIRCMLKVQPKGILGVKLENEWEVWSKLEHPKFLDLFGVFHDTKNVYWATEFAPGD